MRAFIVATTLAISLASVSAMAQTASSSAAAAYTTADTDIGTLLDDPAARAVLDKYIPGFSKGDNVDMARSMTLKTIQQFAPDMITDKALSSIDTDLAALTAKK